MSANKPSRSIKEFFKLKENQQESSDPTASESSAEAAEQRNVSILGEGKGF